MRVFLGTAEIAGMMMFFANALREIGHEVTTCAVNSGDNFYNYSYDIVLNKKIFPNVSSNRLVRKAQNFVNVSGQKWLKEQTYLRHRDLHDVYIFMWDGFLPEKTEDYEYLKRKGKKIISLFLGSDIRHISAFTQEYGLDTSTWEKWFHVTDINRQLFRLRKAELFSDAIFSVPDQSGLSLRPYYKIYIPFDARSVSFNVPRREVPRIVHIPSRSGIKGTSFILEALEELKKEKVQFEFEFISGVPNEIVLEKLQDADILIDEIYLHGPGTLSLEGIASGCAVATKTIKGEAYEEVICNIDLDNLKEKIRRLIQDMDYRVRIAIEGRRLIETINDPIRIVENVLEKISDPSKANKDYDYFPTFFSEKYKLNEDVDISFKNKELTRKIVEEFKLADSLNIKRMQKERLI